MKAYNSNSSGFFTLSYALGPKNKIVVLFLSFHLSQKYLIKTPTPTHDVILKKKLKIIFFSPPGGARELKLQPFDSESKTTSGCTNSLISKKITPNSLFSFYQSTFRSLRQILKNSIQGK